VAAEPIPRFACASERLEGPVGTIAVASIRGELDLDVCDEFGERLREAGIGAEALVVDMSDVSFMDSSGLRVLLQEAMRFESGGGRFAVVVEGGSPVDRVIALTEVAGRLAISSTREEAIAAVSEEAE